MSRIVLFVTAAVVLVGCATAPSGTVTVPADGVGQQAFDPEPSAARYFVDAVNSWDDAERALGLLTRAIEIDPQFALAYYERANRYRKLGQSAAAYDDYSTAIEVDPGFLQAYRARYEIRVNERGDESGIEDLERAYAIDPDHLDTALTYAGYLSWKQPDQALDIYDRLVSVHPEESAVFVNRAKFYRDRGDFARARDDLQQAVRAGDRSTWIQADLIWMQLATGDREGAVEAAAQLVEREPESPEAVLVAARASSIGGAPRRAQTLYRRYLEYEWADPAVWLEVAMLAAAAGDADGARDALDRFRARKDDRDRVQAAQLSTMVLLGERERALGGLETLTTGNDWDLRPWLIRALVVNGEQAQPIRSQAQEIIANTDGGLIPVLVRSPELWVFSRLYLEREGREVPDGFAIP